MSPLAYSLKMASAATGLSETYLKDRIAEGSLRAKRSSKDGDGNAVGKYIIPAAALEAFVAGLESA